MPVKERHLRAQQMCLQRRGAYAVALAGIGHDVEHLAALLQFGKQPRGMVERHIVVGHAMNDEKRGLIAIEMGEDRACLIPPCIVLRGRHEPLGVVGVVKRPVGHRRAGNPGGEPARYLQRGHQRHVAAIRPAPQTHPVRIDKLACLQPVESGQLILDLKDAHAQMQRSFKGMAAI